MARPANILFSGVGGQGIILASEITSFALIRSGFDVKKSEVHGMAQRGGSVMAHLRYDKKVYSPLIEQGTVDIQVAFEMLESLRYLPLLRRDCTVILNMQKIPPLSVSTGFENYPADVVDELRKRGIFVFATDAFAIAKSLGEVRTVSMVMVGALSCFLPVQEETFLEVIAERVKGRYVTVNKDSFMKGREIMQASEMRAMTSPV